MNRQRILGPGANNPDASRYATPTPKPRTAVAVRRGEPRHLPEHLRRLEAGALALGETVPWLLDLAEPLREWLAVETPREDAALRLVLIPAEGQLEARLEPLPVAPRPYRLYPMPHPLLQRRSDPIVTHKGLSGPWGGEVLSKASRWQGDDALLLWPDGTLAETAIAAVGLELEGVLWLPPAEGRVASLAERLDLPEWASERGLRLNTGDIPFEWVERGSLWCMNSLRGIWPAVIQGEGFR